MDWPRYVQMLLFGPQASVPQYAVGPHMLAALQSYLLGHSYDQLMYQKQIELYQQALAQQQYDQAVQNTMTSNPVTGGNVITTPQVQEQIPMEAPPQGWDPLRTIIETGATPVTTTVPATPEGEVAPNTDYLSGWDETWVDYGQ